MNDIEREQYFKEEWIKIMSEIAKVKEEIIRDIISNPDTWQYRAYMYKWGNR